MFGLTGNTAMAGLRGVSWLFLALAMAGCGNVGQVSGKISYQDKPLPDGTVMLLASDGRVYDGQIQPDGTFHIDNVPTGRAKVSVTSMIVPGPVQKTGGGQEGGGIKSRAVAKNVARSRIPAQYGDFEKSRLTVTVEKGKTATLELNLK